MKLSSSLKALTFLAFSVVDAAAWALIKPEHPAEDSTHYVCGVEQKLWEMILLRFLERGHLSPCWLRYRWLTLTIPLILGELLRVEVSGTVRVGYIV